MKMLKKLKSDEKGLIPLLIILFAIIICLIFVAYMRVLKAHH